MSASDRSDLPKNAGADEYRKIARDAILEYLRDKSSREERKEIIKEALKELMQEKAADFGWLSFRTLFYTVVVGAIALWLYSNGWRKP